MGFSQRLKGNANAHLLPVAFAPVSSPLPTLPLGARRRGEVRPATAGGCTGVAVIGFAWQA